ncbi:MAG: hypothetical protein KIT09_21355 [Bryobacteraceae bacterium]|nr:hypothetical protein [Bryobacteraceae bacterium]
MTAAVHIFVWAFTAYLAAGFVFAVLFVIFGAQRIDSQAPGSTLGFRAIVIPGATALWPLLLARWTRGVGDPPGERNAHRNSSLREV